MMRAPLFDPALLNGAETGRALERAALAIGRLDARVSASFVTAPWALRASWTGYARALQLHGVEINEIDVFSWGTGVAIPGRTVRATTVDCFAAFAPWRVRLAQKGRHWAEDLPFTPRGGDASASVSLLVRAIDLLAQWLSTAPGLDAWLALPILIHRLGLTGCPLPCLVAGDARLRFGARDPAALLRRLLGDLAACADAGLESLTAMEHARAYALVTLRAQHRPGALSALLALLQGAPVQAPEGVSRHLGITLSGAGKLLQRAASLGMVREISNRGSWRVYLTPDLAITLGFASPQRGRRPRPPQLPVDAPDTMFSSFDREMADWDRRFGAVAISDTTEPLDEAMDVSRAS